MCFFLQQDIAQLYCEPQWKFTKLDSVKTYGRLKKQKKTKTENRKTRKEFHFRETLSFTNQTQM